MLYYIFTKEIFLDTKFRFCPFTFVLTDSYVAFEMETNIFLKHYVAM